MKRKLRHKKRPPCHQIQKNGKSKQGNQHLQKFKLKKCDKKITIFVTNNKKSVNNVFRYKARKELLHPKT